MTKAPSLSPDEITRLLKKHGFELARIKGSHQIFKNKSTRMNCCDGGSRVLDMTAA